MPYITCQSCGNSSVQTLDINICTRCIKLGNDKTKILAIKKYLEKYPETKLHEISQALGISREIIEKFIKEGSLMLSQNGEKITIADEKKDKENEDKDQKRKNLLRQLSNMENYSKQRFNKEERSQLLVDLEKKKGFEKER